LSQLRFDDRVIIVTGAGRGIGRCHALLLAARGARVVVVDNGAAIDGTGSSQTPADDVVREITDAGGQAVACHGSVASEADAGEMIDTAVRTFGRLDAVINNAGISDPGPFESLTVDQFRTMLDVHFFGALFVIKAAWPHMVREGYGRIVNTVSEAMLGGLAELTSYGAAKGAVFGLTRNLATEGAAHGIRVNAVAPRAYTRMSAEQSNKVAAQMSLTDDVMDQINASMPPDLCAPAAAFLAHESCRLNGEILLAGMGSVARIAAVVRNGVFEQEINPEHIADNLDRIMDVREARVSDAAAAQL
jgi:NAD(P)-dependent dehydrogenase (short-subunit alcohol dehydrogenase family)